MRNIQNTLAVRRAEYARVDAAAGGLSIVRGKIKVVGAGEVLFDVNFPVAFFEQPTPAFGHVLEQGQSVTSGSSPEWSASVVDWSLVERESQPFFVGCTVSAFVSGVTESFLTFIFLGNSLTNPVSPSMSSKAKI